MINKIFKGPEMKYEPKFGNDHGNVSKMKDLLLKNQKNGPKLGT